MGESATSRPQPTASSTLSTDVIELFAGVGGRGLTVVMAAAAVLEFEGGGPGADLLDAVRAEQAERDAAQVRMLHRMLDFCAAHEVPADRAATVSERGRDTGLPLAGAGAPHVSEFAIVELAAALSMTVEACQRQVGELLEVRYRLPRIWARVVAGELPWWRAGRIAQHTMLLPTAGASSVDRQLAAVAHKVGTRLTEKLCVAALDRFDPDRAEERRRDAAEARRVDVCPDAGQNGAGEITATTDTADALDFEAAVGQAAEELRAAGSGDTLDVRRSRAVGVIARHYLGGALDAGRREGGPLVKARQVTINVHLRDQGTGRCETTRSPITVAQVRDWCTNPDTQVVIKPVKDQNHHIRVDAYEVPDRLDDQVNERDGTCIHPWCTRPATACDDDHCLPHDDGGPTSSDNVAPLCRRHHRTKTHAGWAYRFLRPGAYLWRSPSGHWYHRDGTGTTNLGRLGLT